MAAASLPVNGAALPVKGAAPAPQRRPKQIGLLKGFLRFFRHFKKYIRAGEMFSGALLVAIGVLIFTDRLTWLIRFLPKNLSHFTL